VRKIALLTPMLQPYRVSFYEKLSKSHFDTKWMIFHGVKKTEDGRPAYSGNTSFDNVGLVERKYRIGPFTLLIHKGLSREVKRFDPDMIIIQAITGNLSYRRVVNWASRKNKTIINWTCAWDPGLARGVLLGFKNLLVANFFKKGHAFLTYSSKAIDYVIKRGIDPEKITVCYNGIEIDDLIRNEKEIIAESEVIRDKLDLNGNTVFLYVGGLLEDKKVEFLIDAFHLIENVKTKLLIIGDGPLKSSVLSKINSLNEKRIIYLGRIIDGVDPYFAASTCLVLPGAGGLALNQAMLWRRICIAGEADGTEDDLVLDGITGFRFKKDNLSDLVRVMKNVIALDDFQLKEMGEKAREIIVKKSNVNNMVDVFTSSVQSFYPELRING
jgi:glycosyltransferase involved in cell wall biosynthesis